MKDSFRVRLLTALNTLFDHNQARIILSGPLPLWMQIAFEQEAERIGVPVSEIVYDVLFHAARQILGTKLEDEE